MFLLYFCGMKRLVLLLSWLPLLTWGQDAPLAPSVGDSLAVAPVRGVAAPWCVPPVAGLGHWETFPLHAGLNAAMTMSATVGLDRHAPHGVGLGRSLGMAYANPLGQRWSYAVGLNAAMTDWGGMHGRSATLGGAVSYQCTDAVSLGVMGYKDLVKPDHRMFYDYWHEDSYVGGAVNMKFSPSVFLQVSFGVGSLRGDRW